MSELLLSEGSALHTGIQGFEPYIYDLHKAFKREEFIDWPTVVLTTTIQSTAISLFKLLPSSEVSQEPLDMRSIATIIRNIVDTHDVLEMLINTETPEEYNLHRDIMGLYLSSRINKVQTKIAPEKAQKSIKRIKSVYWESIRRSPLYNRSMDRLESGETIFYKSRQQRVEKACGKHADFLMGVLTDLSTYVHSMPPSMWMSSIESIFSNNASNRDMVAVWLMVSNFYFSRCITLILKMVGGSPSPELESFLKHYESVFSNL